MAAMSTIAAVATIAAAGASVVSGLEQKSAAKKQARAQQRQAETQARLSAARTKREARVRQARLAATAGTAGVAGSLLYGTQIGLGVSEEAQQELIGEGLALQEQQIEARKDVATTQAYTQIAGGLGTITSTVYGALPKGTTSDTTSPLVTEEKPLGLTAWKGL